jgi:hypothetical protein
VAVILAVEVGDYNRAADVLVLLRRMAVSP